MSTIHFTCPHCSHTTQLASSTEGMNGNCPSCKTEVVITPDNTTCPTCSKKYNISPAKIGKHVICQACRNPFIVRIGAGFRPTAWRLDGRLILLIDAKEHHFDTCPISNEPATTHGTFVFKRANYAIGCLFGWVWMFLLQKKFKIQIPLSENVARRRNKYKKISRILLTLTVCGILIPVLLVSLSEELFARAAGVFAPLFFCIFPAFYFERKSPLRCTRITDDYIYLRGANREFLKTLPPMNSTLQ